MIVMKRQRNRFYPSYPTFKGKKWSNQRKERGLDALIIANWNGEKDNLTNFVATV